MELLSAREKQVLDLVIKCHTTKEIAEILGVSYKTAETHRYHIMKKMEVHNVAELIQRVQETIRPQPMLTSDSPLVDLQREHSRLAELIRFKVCGDPRVTISPRMKR